MIKRAASLILSASITVGTIPVFAEPNLNDEQNNAIISTEAFTDENVIYSALQNMNDGVSLFSDAPDEIAADFDVVLGFDMSSDMYGFDYNGEMEWKDDFTALQEQAPAGTRFSLVTGETGEFGTDLNSMISALPDTYSGSTDIVTLLENCADTFDDESDDRNKVVIATTAEVGDSAVLENEMDELRGEGIIPFVFILNADESIGENDYGVNMCTSNLSLRLAISDLYLSFAEFRMPGAQTLSDTVETDAEISDDTGYDSDLKNRNIYDDATTVGSALISVLNANGCLPFGASNGTYEYNLAPALETLAVDTRVSFVKGQTDLLDEMNVTGFEELWEAIYTNEKEKINVSDVIKNNLIKRFPVVIEYQSSDGVAAGIVTSLDANQSQIDVNFKKTISIDSVISAFDTYNYFNKIAVNSKRTVSSVTYDAPNVSVKKTYMTTYDTNNVSVLKYTGEGAISILENRQNNELQITSDVSSLSNDESNDDKRAVIIAARVSITDDNIPELYDTSPLFMLRLYTDIPSEDVWYWDYLLEATNLGITNGDEHGAYNPDSNLTRCQFVKMLLEAAQIDINSETDGKWNTTHWAVDYMNKADELEILYWDDTRGDDEIAQYFDEEIRRYEAAYILKTLLMDRTDAIQIPTLLYNYPIDTKSEAASHWEVLSTQFNETNSKAKESMRQLYMNNIFVGDENGDLKLGDTISKAEATKIVIKPLFEIDENLPQIIANVFESEDAELVNLHLDSNGIELNDIVFDNNNERKYVLTIDQGDSNKYFAGLSEDSNAELSISSDNSDGCTLEMINNAKCYTLQGAGTY
ncbi:MAG: S-layer homology domain-containing protein, partial [bacterium]|nr:S-layer homology domain-containing protein [bacterium]